MVLKLPIVSQSSIIIQLTNNNITHSVYDTLLKRQFVLISKLLKLNTMNYLGEIIVYLSALVAIKGETWNKNEPGLQKITLTGYLTILFASIGLILSIINNHQASIENMKNKKIIETTEANTADSKLALQKANYQIDSLNTRLAAVNSRLMTYQEIIDQIKVQSDRQDQTVMMEFVQLKPGQSWQSPSLIYSGSRLEFLGFESELMLEYGSKQELIPKWDGHAIETAIMSTSGMGYNIRLTNNSNILVMGKVHVISSPRVRSNDWSWIEEKLKKE
jgi:hypothetical protein